MDFTSNINQTMDIDVDFGNQSCQPTRMISMFANNNTFNFEDTEVTFEFTRYIQQLCNEMEEAKNRIDCSDSEAVKNLLEGLIDKIQNDISIVNNSLNGSLNNSFNNKSILNNTTLAKVKNEVINTENNTVNNSVVANSKTETSILGLLADIFRDNKNEKSPIENISKLNILSKSLKDLSATLSANQSMNITSTNERSILRSIREQEINIESKENATCTTIEDMNLAEATFINKSVCSPLMELLSAVEKKIDIEKIETELKSKYEKELNEKDNIINKLEKSTVEKDDIINKLEKSTIEKDDIINKLEKSTVEKDDIINKLEKSKVEKDEIINKLEHSTVEKDDIINKLKKGKVERDGKITKLEERVIEKENLISKLEQDLASFKERCKNYDDNLEQLERQKKENEILDEIISDEKRKLGEKQKTIEELHFKINENMKEILDVKNKNTELVSEINRLKVFENQNESLNEQIADLLIKVKKIFELEKNITILNVECKEKQAQIENISYKLKTNQDLCQRLSKEKIELMDQIEVQIKEDSNKAKQIQVLNTEKMNLKAQLSLQNDKCDFIAAKLKDTNILKSQLERDRKDVCWQINELLKNPDIDFDDLKTFLIRVEEKINNVTFKKPKGAAFVKSLLNSSSVKEVPS